MDDKFMLDGLTVTIQTYDTLLSWMYVSLYSKEFTQWTFLLLYIYGTQTHAITVPADNLCLQMA